MSELPLTSTQKDDQWIYVSDMMAGLMMIFLVISISFIKNIGDRYGAYENKKKEICNQLVKEFKKDERQWNMSICENGILIKFDNKLNFEEGNDELSEKFKIILDDFFPRLMRIVLDYEDSINELRIEGHTNSRGKTNENQFQSYLSNTFLSQGRSRNVLEHSLKINEIQSTDEYLQWAYSNITAHGLSSSKRIFKEGGQEDFEGSRRVEFRLRLKEEDNILKLIRRDLRVDDE